MDRFQLIIQNENQNPLTEIDSDLHLKGFKHEFGSVKSLLTKLGLRY